jgi:transposase
MKEITTIGLDLAKQVFHAVYFSRYGQVVSRRKLRRAQVLRHLGMLEPAVIAMEACASAHYWGRELEALGHQVKLLPPQHVKAYVRGNKNDYNDALAIGEALLHGQIRCVPIKTASQQDIQSLHRMRAQSVAERTALCNQTRGLLGEYGIVLPRGVGSVRRGVPEVLEDAENGLSDRFRRLLAESYLHLQELDARIKRFDQELLSHSRESDACRRLQTIPGFGPIVSSVFSSVVGNGTAYRRGRDVSASLGLVPRQHSSGGKARLSGISKRGDGYLRGLLIHGARSVVQQADGKIDRLSRWINRVRETRGYNKAVVALANKLARIGWAVLRHNAAYQPA